MVAGRRGRKPVVVELADVHEDAWFSRQQREASAFRTRQRTSSEAASAKRITAETGPLPARRGVPADGAVSDTARLLEEALGQDIEVDGGGVAGIARRPKRWRHPAQVITSQRTG